MSPLRKLRNLLFSPFAKRTEAEKEEGTKRLRSSPYERPPVKTPPRSTGLFQELISMLTPTKRVSKKNYTESVDSRQGVSEESEKIANQTTLLSESPSIFNESDISKLAEFSRFESVDPFVNQSPCPQSPTNNPSFDLASNLKLTSNPTSIASLRESPYLQLTPSRNFPSSPPDGQTIPLNNSDTPNQFNFLLPSTLKNESNNQLLQSFFKEKGSKKLTPVEIAGCLKLMEDNLVEANGKDETKNNYRFGKTIDRVIVPDPKAKKRTLGEFSIGENTTKRPKYMQYPYILPPGYSTEASSPYMNNEKLKILAERMRKTEERRKNEMSRIMKELEEIAEPVTTEKQVKNEVVDEGGLIREEMEEAPPTTSIAEMMMDVINVHETEKKQKETATDNPYKKSKDMITKAQVIDSPKERVILPPIPKFELAPSLPPLPPVTLVKNDKQQQEQREEHEKVKEPGQEVKEMSQLPPPNLPTMLQPRSAQRSAFQLPSQSVAQPFLFQPQSSQNSTFQLTSDSAAESALPTKFQPQSTPNSAFQLPSQSVAQPFLFQPQSSQTSAFKLPLKPAIEPQPTPKFTFQQPSTLKPQPVPSTRKEEKGRDEEMWKKARLEVLSLPISELPLFNFHTPVAPATTFTKKRREETCSSDKKGKDCVVNWMATEVGREIAQLPIGELPIFRF